MANICYNKFYIYTPTEEINKSICEKLKNIAEDYLYDIDITYDDEEIIEGYFESRWVFPMHIFENFFDEFDNEEIYMRCLSEEYGCNYVAMNIYLNKQWLHEQTFDF